MNPRKFISIGLCAVGMLYDSCLDPYAAPQGATQGNYLVVDGFLNAGDNSCTITLSQSIPLASNSVPPFVSDASVVLEDEEGNAATLFFQNNGIYSATNLSLSLSKNYRLHIQTSNGNSYVSDYVPIQQSVAIDSVSWSIDQQGTTVPNVNIQVSSKGSSAQSPYYLWKYEEIWSYTAAYPSDLKYVNGSVVSNRDTTYYCWRTLNSTSILIASTVKLNKNEIHQFSLNTIPTNSVKFQRGYSILVKQLSITQAAFEYWQQLAVNTENLGTIFGVQPTRFSGNIHSLTNPSEPVFGYFMASAVSAKRIFIKPTDLPSPTQIVVTGYENCSLDTIKSADLVYYAGGSVFVSSYGIGPVGYLTTSIECVDCRMQGGTIVKPDFWP